jgi:hypothetical protein
MDRQHIEELVKAAFWKLLGKKSFIQGAGLIERLAKVANLDNLAVQGALSGLEKEGWLSGVCNGIPMGKVTPLVEKPAETPAPSYLIWKDSLSGSVLSEADQETLLPLHDVVSDMEQSDHRLLIQGLARLRDGQASHHGRPSFLVSAEYLLGSSKILDLLPAASLRQFGIDKSRLLGAPPVLLIAGPPDPANVVLVENPHSFWQAISTEAIEKTAFIVTFGYGLSRQSDEFGNQLAAILESGYPITGAVCAGSPPKVADLLRHPNTSFWGDLDHEAFRIYGRLKKIIPAITLSALYEPMLPLVRDLSTSHPYVKIVAKDGQARKEITSTDPILKMLESSCRDRAVDQELVTTEDIMRYAGTSLKLN